jgi:hypothetical protein
MPSYQELVREALRASESPLTLDQLLQYVQSRQEIRSANPRSTVRNAVGVLPEVVPVKRGTYGYLPRLATGSVVVIDLAQQLVGDRGHVLLPAEAGALLSVGNPQSYESRTVSFVLPSGRTATARHGRLGWPALGDALVGSPEFAEWLAGQRAAGANALVVRCVDGLTGHYALSALRRDDDEAAILDRDETVRAAARDVAKGKELRARDLALQLIARGTYQAEPPPHPLRQILLEGEAPFVVEIDRITFRPDLPPAFRRVFADRLRAAADGAMPTAKDLERLGYPVAQFLREATADETEAATAEYAGASAKPAEAADEPSPNSVDATGLTDAAAPLADETADDDAEEEAAERPSRPATALYRLRVRLESNRAVWRVIELLDNETLEALHFAIQGAFGWDRDHLYCFYMSGKRDDALTEVLGLSPFGDVMDGEPPFADAVTLGDFELAPRQHLHYLFDFGDELRHDVEVLARLPVPANPDEYPKIVERHGEPPPQYPRLDEDEEEDGGDEDGEAETQTPETP